MTPQARYQQAHRAMRLCRACPRPVVDGLATCAEHAAADRDRAEATVRARDAAGLCRRCGDEPRVPGGRWGAECRRIERAKVANRREEQRAC